LGEEVMKINDIVELVDETVFDGRWAGRMTVVHIYDVDGDFATCVHPDMGISDFPFEDLVVMEETDEPS